MAFSTERMRQKEKPAGGVLDPTEKFSHRKTRPLRLRPPSQPSDTSYEPCAGACLGLMDGTSVVRDGTEGSVVAAAAAAPEFVSCYRENTGAWEPVQLGAEYSPEIALLLYTGREDAVALIAGPAPDQDLRVKAKRHLLALGWSIWSKTAMITRFRYDSPGGRRYFSFIQVIRGFLDARVQRTQGAPDHGDTSDDDVIPIPAKHQPESDDPITDYIDFMAAKMQGFRRNEPRQVVEQLKVNAKEHLKSAGWSFWLKRKNDDRSELRYRAPHGRSYNSLHTACKAYQELKNAPPPTRRISSDSRDDDWSDTDRCDSNGNTRSVPSHSSSCGKSKKRKTSTDPESQARVLRSRIGDAQNHHASATTCRSLISVLVDKNILVPRDKLTYRREGDGRRTKEGMVAGDGIKCMCCNETFTVAGFEAHAGSSTRRPYARMFLRDGRSLSQCLVQLMDGSKLKGSPKVLDPEDDAVCSICNDGGELLLCHGCPSAFHHVCVGLEVTPQGDWFCPSCTCSICHSSNFTETTVLCCDQCERSYHVDCVRNSGCQLSCRPEGPWLCSEECSKISQYLQQQLIGTPIPTPVEGVSCTILRSCGGTSNDDDDMEMAERHMKLCLALDVLHECFVPLTETRTQSDLTEDIIFNRESDLRRLNFRGFYTIALEKGGELISAGTLRVHGSRVAELPLVGTRFAYRRQGMCRLLMNVLEKLLSELGVERLVLPAVPELLETWTGSFGFTAMSDSDRQHELEGYTILGFHGTTMCQKVLTDQQCRKS